MPVRRDVLPIAVAAVTSAGTVLALQGTPQQSVASPGVRHLLHLQQSQTQTGRLGVSTPSDRPPIELVSVHTRQACSKQVCETITNNATHISHWAQKGVQPKYTEVCNPTGQDWINNSAGNDPLKIASTLYDPGGCIITNSVSLTYQSNDLSGNVPFTENHLTTKFTPSPPITGDPTIVISNVT